ncbi:MAG: hypothetical protein ABFD89_17570 [Bryobacteraceae bacterium]
MNQLIVTEQSGFGAVYTRRLCEVQWGTRDSWAIRLAASANDIRINGRQHHDRPGTFEAIGCWSFEEDLKQ